MKTFLIFTAFVITYLAVDLIVPLIPAWVGYAILISIVIGLFRLMFLIAKEGRK